MKLIFANEGYHANSIWFFACIWCYNWTRQSCSVLNGDFCDSIGLCVTNILINFAQMQGKEDSLCWLMTYLPSLYISSTFATTKNIKITPSSANRVAAQRLLLFVCPSLLWGCIWPKQKTVKLVRGRCHFSPIVCLIFMPLSIRVTLPPPMTAISQSQISTNSVPVIWKL